MMFDDDQNIDPMTGLPVALPSADQPSEPATMNPTVKDYITKKFNLADYSPAARQSLVDQSKPDSGDRATAALAAIGAGFQGQNAATAGMNALNSAKTDRRQKIEDFDKAKASGIQDIGVNKELDEMSPNSEASKRFRATLKANFPQVAEKYGSSFDNLTAADQKNVFQVVETKAKLEEAAAKRESVAATKDLANQMRGDARAEKNRLAMSAQDDKDAKALEKHLSAGWTARSGQAGIVQGKINSAEAAEQLLEQAKTQPGGLDSRQIEELAQSTGRLLGAGGAQASGRIEALVPHTFWGKTQSMKEYLSNNPTGAGLEKFTARMADTIKREKELALNQKRQFQVEGLGSHARLKKSNSALYDDLLQRHGIDPAMMNDKGQYQAPKTLMKTQTNQKTGEKRNVYSDGSTEIVTGNIAGE